MANEVQLTGSLTHAPSATNQVGISRIDFAKRITMTGAEHSQGTQVAGATEEALDISSDIGTIGIVVIKNLDATDNILIGLTGSFPFKLLPGEFTIFRANGAIFIKASANTPSIQYWVFEE